MTMRDLRTLAFRMAFATSVASATLLPSAALATDFRILVPVHLERLPDGAKPQVVCEVFSVFGESEIGLVGRGSVNLPEGVESFDSTVEILIDARASEDPETADEVDCKLSLDGHATPVQSFKECQERGLDPADQPLVCGMAGSSVTGSVTKQVAESLPE